MNKRIFRNFSMRLEIFFMSICIILTAFTGKAESNLVYLKEPADIKQFKLKYGAGNGFKYSSAENSFELTRDLSVKASQFNSKSQPYEPGQRFIVRCSIKGVGIKGKWKKSPIISIGLLGKNNTPMGHKDIALIPDGDSNWTKVNVTIGPFNSTVSSVALQIYSYYFGKGTVYVKDLVLSTFDSNRPKWQELLLTKSFGVDEIQLGDWQRLYRRDWMHDTQESLPYDRQSGDLSLDWDGYKLDGGDKNLSFDSVEIGSDKYGTRSLKLTGPASLASKYFKCDSRSKYALSARVKYRKLKVTTPLPGRGRGCLGAIQVLAFTKRNGKYHYLAHQDAFIAVAGKHDKEDSNWHTVNKTLYLSSAVTHIRLLCRMWEGVTGTLWIDNVSFRKQTSSKEGKNLVKDNSVVTIDGKKSKGPLKKIWLGVDSSIGVSSGTLGPIAQERIFPLLQEAGIKYVRLHYALYKAWKRNDKNGNPIYDWKSLDNDLDLLKKHKMFPMIITEPTALALASKPSKRWINVSPPKDLKRHAEFIKAVVRHCLERYGRDEVSNWYWECWNEPWAVIYFNGSMEDYLKVYDTTVTAIKDVMPTAKVGSIVFDSKVKMLEHFAFGPNLFTGKPGPVPLDFITYHCYAGGGSGIPSLLKMKVVAEELKNLRDKYKPLRKIPIINGEWNACYIGAKEAETVYNAAAVVKCIKEMLDAGIEQTFIHSLWSTNEKKKMLFGLNSIHLFSKLGVPCATINSFRALNMLSGERLPVDIKTNPIDALASWDKNANILTVVLTNFVEDPNMQFTTDVNVKIKLPKKIEQDMLRQSIYMVDKDNGDPYTIWKAMGSPDTADENGIKKLMKAAELKLMTAKNINPKDGTVALHIKMPVFSIAIIRLQK